MAEATTTLQLKIVNDASDVSKSLDKTIAKVNELKNAVSKGAKATGLNSIKKAAEGVSKALKSVTVAPFQKAAKRIQTLFHSIGRIAFYRAIRTAIKSVTQGFSEGVKHLYAWSEAFNTKFAPTMDTFATQMTYLKNGFASMFAPLIEWVVPNVIVPLTDALVELFNYIQQGFAILVGHDYWYKAQKSMQKFGESTKKANIQLAKFDELNNLTESNNGNEEDASGMFTLEKVALGAKFSFFEKLREAIKNGEWKDVGSILADGINNAFESIDPESLVGKVSGIINSAIDFFLGFGTELEWTKIGEKIGDIIDKLLNTINWEGLGEVIGTLAKGLAQVIIAAFKKIKISDIKRAVEDFLSGLIKTTMGITKLYTRDAHTLEDLLIGLGDAPDLAYMDALSIVALLEEKITNGVDVTIDDVKDIIKTSGLTKLLGDEGADAVYAWYNSALRPMEEKTKYASDEIIKTFGQTGKGGVSAFVNNDWGTTVPTDRIKYAVATSGIDAKYRTQASNALAAYVGVQWGTGGTVSADGIKNALVQAGVPIKMAEIASTGLSSFINTLTLGGGTVTTAFGNMLGGAVGVGANAGKNCANQFVASFNGVLDNTTIKHDNGLINGGKFHMVKDARGGFMAFGTGGFPSLLTQGTMYVAGEVPGQAEMVGNINGRTGVASGFEITGIRDAVIASGENEAQLLTRLITTLERKNLVIAPSAQLGRVMAQSNRLYGAVTG